MGSYLATACKEVDEELGSGNGMEYGVGEMQVCGPRLIDVEQFLLPRNNESECVLLGLEETHGRRTYLKSGSI